MKNHRSSIASIGCAAAVLTVLAAGCDPLALQGGMGFGNDALLRLQLAAQGAAAIEEPNQEDAMVELGQALFFDKLLSGNRNISCATCHHPVLATGDGLSLSSGQGGAGLGTARSFPVDGDGNTIFVPRNAPDVFNRGNFRTMFWDGRVALNEDGSFTSPAGADLLPGLDNVLSVQAMFPVTSSTEMRGSAGESELGDLAEDDFFGIWAALMARILAIEEYRTLFAAAYPGVSEADLTFAHAANAVAAFEIQTWTLSDSPFDQYLRGDNSALSAEAKAGAALFYGAAGCADCHTGPLMTDESFHNICVPQLGPGKGHGADGMGDFGREGVTNDPNDRYSFRTPPLRNVAATGPWMHDGAFTSLEDVVQHFVDPVNSAMSYDETNLRENLQAEVQDGQTADIVVSPDPALAPKNLTAAQVGQIVRFLESLTSPSVFTLGDTDVPTDVPSGLPLAD